MMKIEVNQISRTGAAGSGRLTESAAAAVLRRLRWRPGFFAGLVCGILLLLLARVVINRTIIVDWLVSPLILSDTAGSADAIVILGAGLTGACVPNHAGISRVLLGARVFHQQRAPFVVITGGLAGAGCPIAEAMRRLAVEVGVDPDRLFVETASRSTRENALRTAPILRGLGVRKVLLVTDRLHMRRGAGAFAALGFEVERAGVPVEQHAASNVELGFAGIREFTAWTYYRLRGWLETGLDDGSEGSGSMPSGREQALPAAQRNPEGPIAVLGASYALGWQPGTIGGVSVVNLGVTGQQSFELLGRFERDVLPLAPRAVILWGFINDIFRAPPGQLPASLERTRASFRKMVELARQHGIQPIVATEITVPRDDSWREMLSSWLRRRESYQDAVNRNVMETNAWLVEFGRQEGVLVLDFHAVLAEPGGERRREFADPDGSHVSAAGYAALSEYARPVLEKHVINR